MNKRSLDWYKVQAATFGPIGYCIAPGTLATIVSLPIVCMVRYYIPNFFLYGLFFGLICYGAYYTIEPALRYLGRNDDPGEIVIDEFLGCLCLFWTLPLSFFSIVVGILLFRIFDIFKPLGIKRIETCGRIWGILLDDIAAGLLSNIIVQLFFS